MKSYLDDNGLVEGNIPAKQPCPFAGNCTMQNERCPTEGNTKPNAYSCGAARLHSIYKQKEKREQAARDFVSLPFPSAPCECGSSDAYWKGDTMRVYLCEVCHQRNEQ